MNNVKTTSKTIKLSIFAVIIFSMVVPISAGSDTIMASAQIQDDSQRLAQKISDINQNFVKYLKTQQAAMNAELQIYDIDQKITKQNNLNDIADVSLLAQKATLETKLNVLLQEIDALQEQSYTLHEIPDAKMQKLKEVKSQVIQQYITLDRLDTIFIDAAEESIQVILLSTPTNSNNGTTTIPSDPSTPKRSARSVGDDYPSLAEKYGIAVEVKEFTASSRTSTHIQDSDVRDCTSSTKNQNCGPLAGGVEICPKWTNTKCAPSTLGFPATRNGVSGFVTVAHAFPVPSGFSGKFPDDVKNKVYQKGPSSSNKKNIDTVYVRELIGKLVYAVYEERDGKIKKDSAFVQLQSGARTLPQEIVSSGTTNFDIAGYSKSDNDNRIGAYVAKSGMKTGVTAGKIVFGNSTDVFATYNECTGDSGSPVGKLRGFSFTVYGMHLGTSDDPNYNIQKCGKNHDGYSRYMPYTKIKSDLNLD